MKHLVLVSLLILSGGLVSCGLIANASNEGSPDFYYVPNTVKDMSGTNIFEETFVFSKNSAIYNSCAKSLWDFAFTIKVVNSSSGVASVYSKRGNEDRVLLAQATFDGATLTSTHYQVGAVFRKYNDVYNQFLEGSVIPLNNGETELLDINLNMGPDYPWYGCSSFEFEFSGGIAIVPVSVSTTNMDCGICLINSPCQTVKMRTPEYWRRVDRSRFSVYIYGVNFGNAVNGSDRSASLALQSPDSDNAHAIALQLNQKFGAVPPVSSGRPECYGINFDEITLQDGTKVSPKTNVETIVNLIIKSVRDGNINDYSDLCRIAKALNTINN